MSELDLEGRTAVVTGGGRGIGAAVARRLAEAGARVVVAARTGSEIERVAVELTDRGHAAAWVGCDVTSEEDVARLADEAGPTDVLVNNAGVATSSPLKRTSLESWTHTLAVNATGAFLCTRAFTPGMAERGWGRVVNVASVAGLSAGRYMAAYAASKHAMIGLTRAAAAELVEHGVTVNAICPGYVDTPMTDASIARIVERTGRTCEEAAEAILSSTPQHRLISPEEVAAAAAYLCSDAAASVNGTCLVLDGGQLRR